MAAKVLSGTAPGDIPVKGVDKTELYINLSAASAMGVELPNSVIERAKEVIQ